MNRKREIERMIVGSLLSDFDEYYPMCQCGITADMFNDKMMRRVYGCMIQLHKEGMEVNISTVVERLNIFIGEIVSDLCGIAAFESFLHKKTEYNMNQELFSKEPKYTEVTFEDYLKRFVLMTS